METRGQKAWKTRREKYGVTGTSTAGRKRLSEVRYENPPTPEQIEKMRKKVTGISKPTSGWRGKRSDEYRRSHSEMQKRNWEDPEKRAKWLDAFSSSETFGSVKESKLELMLAEALDEAGIKYERHAKIGRYRVDFLDGKHVYEAYGCYWHCCPDCFPDAVPAAETHAYDLDRMKWIEDRGYDVTILWEHDIHGHKMNERGWCCASKLRDRCSRFS